VRFPIEASRLQLIVVGPAEVVKRFEKDKPRDAWAPRTDENGEVLWRVELVALWGGAAEVIRVVVPGDPNVAEGEMVRAESLTAQAWEMEGRFGMSFRASSIQAAKPRAAATEKAAA